jgi:hypothetical protein
MRASLYLWEKLGCLLSRNNVNFWFSGYVLVMLVIMGSVGSSPGVAVAQHEVAPLSYFTVTCWGADGGLSPCQLTGNVLQGASPFLVYTTEEVDTRLRTLDGAIKKTNEDLKTTADAIRTEVRDSVITALRGLPPQLFSSEVQERLMNMLATRLEASLQAQEDRLRAELLAEIARRLPGPPVPGQ